MLLRAFALGLIAFPVWPQIVLENFTSRRLSHDGTTYLWRVLDSEDPDQVDHGLINQTWWITGASNAGQQGNCYTGCGLYWDNNIYPYDTFPLGWLQGYVKSGTFTSSVNRLSFKFYCDTTVTNGDGNAGGFVMGTYIKGHTVTADAANQGQHYYHRFATNVYANHWVYAVMNQQPQHIVGGDVGTMPVLDPEWNAPTDQGTGGGTQPPVHYFDGMTRFYFDTSPTSYSAHGQQGGGWELNNCYFSDFEFAIVNGEPDHLVSNTSGTYNGTAFQATFDAPNSVNQTYSIAYSRSDLHINGFASGTSGGTVQSTGTDYPSITWTSPALAEGSGLYVGVQPQGGDGSFTQIFVPSTSPNPSLAIYNANFRAAMQAVQNSIAVKPQPRVLTTAQHIPSNLNWVNSGQGSCDPAANTCPFNSTTKFNAFTDGMETNGASGLDLNIDLVVMSAASQYTGSIATDCPSGWRCKSLANLDALIAHAAGDGLTVKLRPSMGNVVTPCGLTSSSNEAAAEACIKPLEVAAALRWPTTVQRISILHEAVGAFGSDMPMPLTVSFVHTLLVNTAAALHTANASLKVGAAAETMFAADAAYFNDYLTISGLNYIGVDLYGSSCDVSQYPTTAVSTLASWGASIATAGKQGDIEEAAAPRWLPLTCTNPGEQFAYEGSGDSDFLATQPIWLDVITRAAGAYGYRSFSLFPSPPLLWTTSDAPNSFMTSGTYVADMMAHLTESTLTGARYARTQGWYSGSIQGKAATAGRITLIADAGCNSVANDTSVHIATFYNGVRTFAPPASPGAIYADAQYNCPVTRLSNGFTQFNKSIGPEYSSPSAMNQNDTLIMLGTSDGFYAAVDKFGHVVVPFANLHIAGTPGPRWMYGDPYSFVYLKSGGTKNVLAKGTIPTNYNACRPTCTVTETILHTFPEYSILDIGGGEGDLQNDNFIALNGTLVSDGTNEVFVYDMANDVKHTPLNYGSSANFNNAEPMPTTDVAVCLTAGPVISGVVYPGKFLFDNDMTFIRKLSTGCDHDTFFAYNGHRWHASTDGMAQFCSQAGFYTEDIDIGPSSAVCHHNGQFPHGTSTHMGSAKDGSGWVSISLVDYSTVPNSASYSLNGIWNQGCGPNNVVGGGFGFWCSYQDEIMAYDFAHDKLYRVAQHRSCPQSATQQSYSKIPKASMARDGAYISYSSDMCLGYNAPLNDYRDGWMVDVTSIRNR